jgi:hypothetical protein
VIGGTPKVAYAVVHNDPPDVYIARDDEALTRLLALEVVARTSPEALRSREEAEELRTALLEERWADAVVAWIEITGTAIDAYPDESIWSSEDLSSERVLLEMRLGALFRD